MKTGTWYRSAMSKARAVSSNPSARFHRRRLDHAQQRDALGHQAESPARGGGHAARAGVAGSGHHVNSGDLVFGLLHQDTGFTRPAGQAGHDAGGGAHGIAGIEAHPAGHRAQGDGLVSAHPQSLFLRVDFKVALHPRGFLVCQFHRFGVGRGMPARKPLGHHALGNLTGDAGSRARFGSGHGVDRPLGAGFLRQAGQVGLVQLQQEVDGVTDTHAGLRRDADMREVVAPADARLGVAVTVGEEPGAGGRPAQQVGRGLHSLAGGAGDADIEAFHAKRSKRSWSALQIGHLWGGSSRAHR
jgi:hypothetical protein